MITVSILLDSVEKIQRFVSIISKYSCDFDIESGHSCIDAKSLVGLFSLDISKPLRLTINDDGILIEDILRDIQEFMEYKSISTEYFIGFHMRFMQGRRCLHEPFLFDS